MKNSTPLHNTPHVCPQGVGQVRYYKGANLYCSIKICEMASFILGQHQAALKQQRELHTK